MLGEGAKTTIIATIIATIVASIIAVLVAISGTDSQSQQNSEPATPAQAQTDILLEQQTEKIKSLTQKLQTVETSLAQIKQRSNSLFINRCDARTAPQESVSSMFGKGSIAMCAEEEIAISGACQLKTGTGGTSSRFILQDGKPAGYECILSQGTSFDRVRATAICCQ